MIKKKVDPRLFLRGLGGAAIAAPFLSTLGVRSAIGQTDASAPTRVIIYFSHYGCITEKWFPAESQGELRQGNMNGGVVASEGRPEGPDGEVSTEARGRYGRGGGLSGLSSWAL
jgi:hypothetical protein